MYLRNYEIATNSTKTAKTIHFVVFVVFSLFRGYATGHLLWWPERVFLESRKLDSVSAAISLSPLVPRSRSAHRSVTNLRNGYEFYKNDRAAFVVFVVFS